MLDRCSLEDGMRRQLTVAVLLGIAPIICFAQQSSHKLSDYAGTWQANFEGTQFMTIKLVEKDGHMTGSVSCGDINVDLNGDVIRAEAPESESPIVGHRNRQINNSYDPELRRARNVRRRCCRSPNGHRRSTGSTPATT